jgi:hypothetical protein
MKSAKFSTAPTNTATFAMPAQGNSRGRISAAIAAAIAAATTGERKRSTSDTGACCDATSERGKKPTALDFFFGVQTKVLPQFLYM